MDLIYRVHKTNRKTISLTLERNNEVVIKAPNHATAEKIEDFFVRKQEWLYTKLEEKNTFVDYPNKREIQSGRGFYYMGRMYKLEIVEHVDFKLRFHKNKFELNKEYIENWHDIFIEWYIERFNQKILSRVKSYSKKHNLIPEKISIKDLNNKWGNCSKENKISFHWKIILAPISVIDYVIVHELCHIKYKNHSPAYWTLLSRFMPDYDNHKDWLRRYGVELDI